MMQSTNLEVFCGSVLVRKISGSATEVDFAKRLKEFMASDGTFYSTLGSKESSIKNTRLALKVLVAFIGELNPSILDSFADSLLQLLPQGDDETAVDPILLSSLSRISSKKPRLMGPRLVAVTESLLHLRHSDKFETAAGVIESLNFITTYKASPVFVTFRSPTIGQEDLSKTIVVDVFDVLGRPAPIESMEIRSMKKAGRDTALYQGGLEGGLLDLSTIDGISPGLFSVDLSVTVTGHLKPVTKTLAFVVHGALEVVNVALGVTTAKQVSVADLAVLSGQGSLDDMSASAAKGDYIHIALGLSSPVKQGERFHKPHQVFVKFTNQDSGVSTLFVAAADGKLGDGSGSKYRTSVSLSKETERFAHASGVYTVSLLVSDVAYGTPSEWVLGPLYLKFPTLTVKDYPLYTKPLMYTSDNTLKALPEITHVMRPESKRASAFMSTIFTILSIAPLVVFVAFILHLGPNLNLLKSVSSVLFVVCLLVTLFLYAAYWLAMEGASFYDTIKYLCFLVPVTIIIGSSAVSSVSETRIANKDKDKVKSA